MENKINIAELLKDCPKGMELDCLMYDNVIFDYIEQSPESTYPIHCLIKINSGYNPLVFTHYGCNNRHPNAKCVIFPKGKTTWDGFHRPFKDGDIVTYKYENGLVSMILNKFVNFAVAGVHYQEAHYHCALFDNAKGFVTDNYIGGELKYTHLATEEEKQKLFDAIKANGYKWNEETKTLEKLPKAKFDITTLKPFDKVLVRICDNCKWYGDFYMWYDDTEKDCPYNCACGTWSQCVPFEGNEHLLGTTNDCDEFYKTW